MKVRLINTSPAPQRLHILPPQTPYFKIRYHKKGMVPTGVAEEIYVQFTPAADQYKYYYDTIRIHCEGDKILIPIHAYPVINSKLDNILPKVIDMGVGCRLGQHYSKQLQIQSNCPVNFEYEIEVVKPHPEIDVAPLSGDILGLEATPIDFEYNPASFSTAECEIIVRTTEFDFEPHTIRIVGNCAPYAESKMIQLEDMDNGYLEPISEEGQGFNNQSKTLLKKKDVRLTRPGRLSKINAGGKNSSLSARSEESS